MTSPIGDRKIRVLIGSTGIPKIRGGLETGYLEIFSGLGSVGIESDLSLFHGGGLNGEGQYGLWNIPRSTSLARWLGPLIRRPNPYVVEQFSSLLPMIVLVLRLRPQVIVYSEVNLGMALFRLRRWIGGKYRLIYSNVGPGDAPFPFTDHVHQIAPYYVDVAKKAGVSDAFQTLIPYGIRFEPVAFEQKQSRSDKLRQQLGIPVGRKMALSVGWISSFHKRADYIVREFARLGTEAPFLVMLGRMDGQSKEITELASKLLVPGNYLIRSVPYSEVFDYYHAADFFVHAALTEAFGRVFLESAMFGLPCIAHDHPVMRYVLGKFGEFHDLSRDGALTAAVARRMEMGFDIELAGSMADRVRTEFSWEVLASRYQAMFEHVSRLPI